MAKSFRALIILLAVSSLITISSCKKTTVNGHVQTVTVGNNVTTYTYDSQGRVTSLTDGGGTTRFVYNSGSVNVTDPNGGTTVYNLNSNGLATSDNGSRSFSYDNNGYLTSKVVNTGGGTNTTNYTIVDGNITSVSFNNNTTDVVTYNTTPEYRDYGLYFLGKNSTPTSLGGGKSSNLIANDISNGVTFSYTYTYDSHGRVQTQTVSGNNNTTTSVYSYTTN